MTATLHHPTRVDLDPLPHIPGAEFKTQPCPHSRAGATSLVSGWARACC